MQKKIPVKTLYLLLVISIGLIGLGVGSTFAMFTATAEIDNPISLTYSLDYGYDVIETVEATVSANSDRTITLNITNSTSSNLNYTCFYITSNPSVELGTDLSHNTIGTINAGATLPLNVTIRNNTSSEETIVIGVLSNKESITLSEEMRVIPNKELSDNRSTKTLTKLGLSVDTAHTPDFTTCSGNSCRYSGDNTTGHGDGTNGIYTATDDLGTSYYFRGAVNNNYVSFAGKTWRIVRINGDGTIRIALNESAGDSAFNGDFDDNAYVGYMYGTPGSTTYALTHANAHDSTIKSFLDDWYDTNLSSYSSYIADSIFCNDRSISDVSDYWGEATTNTGIGTALTAYSGYKRTYVDHNPSLICPNNNDKFTVSSSIGNGALTKPIGLLTIDEYMMAGAGPYDVTTNNYYDYNSSSGAFYLYDNNSNWYWSMSPDGYYAAWDIACASRVRSDGYVGNYTVYNDYAVRPAVSLKSDAITGGTGTSSDPFQIIPAEYKQVEYIESSGTQYIDTGLTMEKTDSIKLDFRANFTNNAYGGGNGYTQFTANVANNTDTNVVIDYNGTTKKENVYVNGTLDESKSHDWTSNYSGTNVKIGIFKLGNAGNVWYTDGSTTQIGKLYREAIYKNGTLVRNYVPCYRKSDNVAGLYDLVNNQFYTNDGTGSFTHP